jgi:hypothetical protein
MTEQMTIEYLRNAMIALVSIAEEHVVRDCFNELDNAGVKIMDCLDELEQYRAIEKKLEDIFGGKVPVEMVVELLEQHMLEPENPLKMNARILTYEQSAEWDKYLMAKTQLEELSGHGVDVTKLIHYFCETIFEGEQHQGFCILTNEDAEKWKELNAIGTVEELQALKEKSVAKKPRWHGHNFCPKCDSIVYVNGGRDIYCPKCGQHLDWE